MIDESKIAGWVKAQPDFDLENYRNVPIEKLINRCELYRLRWLDTKRRLKEYEEVDGD